MITKKHRGYPHLTGEHRYGDLGQVILLLLFLGIWISDSFIWHYSDFLMEVVPAYIRISVACLVVLPGWYLVRSGMKTVFGTKRPGPEVIRTGVFGIVRHPIYTGAILLILGFSLTTLSIASALFWIPVVGFYIWIARYEERILEEEFGEDYLNYKKKVGMLFPRIFKRG